MTVREQVICLVGTQVAAQHKEDQYTKVSAFNDRWKAMVEQHAQSSKCTQRGEASNSLRFLRLRLRLALRVLDVWSF